MDVRELSSKPPEDPRLAASSPQARPEESTAQSKTTVAEERKPPKTEESAPRKNAWQESPQAKELIESLQGKDTTLAVDMDKETNTIIVRIIDSRTGEVVRKLPIADATNEEPPGFKGLLLDAVE